MKVSFSFIIGEECTGCMCLSMCMVIREQLCGVDWVFPLTYPLSHLSNPRIIFLDTTFVVTICSYEANTYKMLRNTLGRFVFHPHIPHQPEGGQLQAGLCVRYILGPYWGPVATKCGFLMSMF